MISHQQFLEIDEKDEHFRYMSFVMIKAEFCLCETKDADHNCTADQRLCLTTWTVQLLHFLLNPNFQTSSHMCKLFFVEPGQKARRQFSRVATHIFSYLQVGKSRINNAQNTTIYLTYEPLHEKTNNLHNMRKQRRRSASR